jgi:hypothetical protein
MVESDASPGSAGFALLYLAAAEIALVALTAVATALIMRLLAKAKVEAHIDKLYKEIRTKAVAAAEADYSGVPAPLFDLFNLLNKKLGPLIELGGSMRIMVDKIGKALNRASYFTSPKHPIPADGASIVIQPNPPRHLTETKSHPSANSELKEAAIEFNDFWQNGDYIKGLIRATIHNLGGSPF